MSHEEFRKYAWSWIDEHLPKIASGDSDYHRLRFASANSF